MNETKNRKKRSILFPNKQNLSSKHVAERKTNTTGHKLTAGWTSEFIGSHSDQSPTCVRED